MMWVANSMRGLIVGSSHAYLNPKLVKARCVLGNHKIGHLISIPAYPNDIGVPQEFLS